MRGGLVATETFPWPVSVALAAVPILLGWIVSRNKSTADAAQSITSSAVQLTAAQTARISALEAQVQALLIKEDACQQRLAQVQASLATTQGMLYSTQQTVAALRAKIERPPGSLTRKEDQ